MLSIFLNESISTMARSALMRVPIAIYLSRVYLLSRRFFRSSRRFSRKAPTFLEKSPTFFRTTRTFSSISQHLRLHTPHCPSLADHIEGRSTTNPEHSHSPIQKETQALFSTSFAKPTFQTLSIKYKITHTFHRKGEQKGGFHLSHPFFCSKT